MHCAQGSNLLLASAPFMRLEFGQFIKLEVDVKKNVFALSFALYLALFPNMSHSACTLTGVIVRVTAYDSAYTATGGYIYFRTSSLASYYYYVATNDKDMVSNAIAYMNSGRSITIQGNATTCPAVPAAGGAASLGSLNYMYNP